MPRLSQDELASISDAAYTNCRRLLLEASPDEWEAGLLWYPTAHAAARRVALEANLSLTQSAGIIAVLSPRVSWSQNKKDAETIIWDRGVPVAALGNNIVKALRILNGEDVEVVAGGRKVRSFFRNIVAPTVSYDVTIDVWMLRALVDPVWLDPYGRNFYRFLQRRGVYDAIGDGVRRLAVEEGLRPMDIQAIVWVHVRGGAE